MSRTPKAFLVTSTAGAPWRRTAIALTTPGRTLAAGLQVTGERLQTWEGFGGCFNELGWDALAALPAAKREQAIADLFDPQSGCGFTRCRVPIGASDYARSWYSLNEHEGDFAMRKFSIERDRRGLIPYVRLALGRQPGLKLFASPWSPPTWLKSPPVYNYGTLVREPRHLRAYADYFVKFVRAWRGEGMPVDQVHVQNEPVADQKFPSCLWTGAQMRDFIRDYLGPAMRRSGLDCEIWLGTLNTDDYDGFANTVLSDPKARRFVSGVGYQWAGKGAIQRTHQSWPQMRLMQTENECGDGRNTWEYAGYVFDLVRHYLTNGACAYVYWNMVLAPGGRSTWGWAQNAMITADPERGSVTRNPEYWVMKHCSRYVRPGAALTGLTGQWAANAVSFLHDGGPCVVTFRNPFADTRRLTICHAARCCTIEAEPASLNTLVIGD